MIVKTLFHQNGKFELGRVEVKLLPGIPQLHIVGLPDASIRECGIKLKSALRSCGRDWPSGQQIVVSLRPMDFRKGGSGADLPIALAYLAATDQLAPGIQMLLEDHVIYGEIGLDGAVHAPMDLGRVLRTFKGHKFLTGSPQTEIREGVWAEIRDLRQTSAEKREILFDWGAYWRRPPLPSITLHERAARYLMVAHHMKLNVLLAGPQGSGKTTWARLFHALSAAPDPLKMAELASYFGDEALDSAWRPLEQPHHTITPQAMIGGGLPPQPGVISRVHGGVLVMDELLHFHPQVLEALREPIESGYVEIARKGTRARFPAEFQLVATTNLCPCGKLNPVSRSFRCSFSLSRCKSTTMRLSGPLLDRFDFLALSHEWLSPGPQVTPNEMQEGLAKAAIFAATRDQEYLLPDWTREISLSHRRRRSMGLVARGLADLDGSAEVLSRHTQEAFDLVVTPMKKLREIFA